MKVFRKLLPFGFLIAFLFIFYFTDLGTYFSFSYLKEHRQMLLYLIAKHPVLSPLAFMCTYAFLVAISFPGATFLTITGGFLFGQPMSTIYVVFSGSVGAVILFSAARYAFRDLLKRKMSGTLKKIEDEIEQNGAWYLLFLRLVPLFPFWMINLAPAAVSIRTFTFFWTTFLGIIPGSFVYTQAGVGLGAIFDRADHFSISAFFNWQMKIALIALAVFALVPILIKKWKRKKNDRHSP